MVWIVAVIILVACLGFWLWMFWKMLDNHRLVGENRLWWLAMFMVFNVFTAVLYFFTEYNRD